MKNLTPILISFLFLLKINAQTENGNFSIGMRSTISLFDHDENAKMGYGAGGQFRVQVLDRLNTEWFLDYLQQDLGDFAFRKDIHVGWSLMIYPWLLKDREKLQIIKPYLAVGHCFDWSELVVKDYRNIKGSKFGSAVQLGAGTHINLSKRFDITLQAQYMIHLGKDIQLSYDESAHVHDISEENHTNAYGHLLITMGINYKIAKLWKTKKILNKSSKTII